MMNSQEWIQTDLRELDRMLSLINLEEAEALGSALLQAERVFVMGRGRTGLVLEMFAMRLTQLGRQVHIIGSPTTPSVQPEDLFLAASASGKTESVRLAAEQAALIGAKIVVITSRTEGELNQRAAVCLHLTGGDKYSVDTEHSRMPLASIFEQGLLVLLDGVIAEMAEGIGISPEAMAARHANIE